MYKQLQHKVSIFFLVLFLAIVMAPTIIMTIDGTVEISAFYGIGEEEESETLNLVFDNSQNLFEETSLKDFNSYNGYYNDTLYAKPHINLISPPPEEI